MDNEPILKYFRYEHLPPTLRLISKPFHDLAYAIVTGDPVLCTALPRCAERTVALRKLLEAKDAAVRAALEDTP